MNRPRLAASPSRFRQIVESIRSDIVAGALPEHAALPSERVMAEQFGVSRMTARRALEAIEAQGLAYSEDRRGRFVSPKRVRYDISKRVSFAADAHASGTDLEITVLRKRSARADDALSADLSVPIREKLHEYTRLFSINGHPILIETEFVVASRCPDLLDHDLRQSTTRVLEQHYGIAARTGDVVIRMCPIQPDEAAILGLPPYQAGIELAQTIRDDAGKAFCVGRQIWRGELAEFSARAIVNR
ncbi:GntR family transcriptional regulator [Defluviimonas sp. SAOS-178_SWC]|uniref:GntR family transcriptional regulator n=1 Tax=Defluviimonas sp. SAOS-178_SWC TaxID=3121287 RepID=UPI003221A66F